MNNVSSVKKPLQKPLMLGLTIVQIYYNSKRILPYKNLKAALDRYMKASMILVSHTSRQVSVAK